MPEMADDWLNKSILFYSIHAIDQAYKDRTMYFIRDEFVKYGLETELQMFPDPRVSNSVCKPFFDKNKNKFESSIGIWGGGGGGAGGSLRLRHEMHSSTITL